MIDHKNDFDPPPKNNPLLEKHTHFIHFYGAMWRMNKVNERKYIYVLSFLFVLCCILSYIYITPTLLYVKLSKLQNDHSNAKNKLPELISILKSNEHWFIKFKVLDTINSLGKDAYPAAKQLLAMIENENVDKASECAFVLNNIVCPQNRDIKDTIIKLLDRNYNNITIPVHLIEALGKLKVEAITIIPYLENRLSNEHESILRDSIKNTLFEITGNHYVIAIYPDGKAYIELMKEDKSYIEKYIEMKIKIKHEAVKIELKPAYPVP